MKREGIFNAYFIVSISIFLLLIIYLGYFNLELSRENKSLKSHLHSLIPGEPIKHFDLISTLYESKTTSSYNNSGLSLIFIFERPCTPCNKSLTLWKRLARILEGKVEIYGIVLSDYSEAQRFSQNPGIKFNIYIPVDEFKFRQEYRLNLPFAQTLLVYEGKVQYIKLGNLKGEDFTELLQRIKELRKGVNESI